MAEQDVLKNMVLSFRVSELQVLLGYAGRNKSGRKPELQQRAIELLYTKSTPIMMKIRDLHRRREQSFQGKPSASELLSVLDSGSMKSCPQYVSNSRNYSSLNPSASLNYRSEGVMNHNVDNHMNSGNVGYPVHPDVRLKPLPFYDVLAELMRPTSLVPSGNGRFQESHFVFHLTPRQAQDIAMSREVRTGPNGGRIDHFTTQVQLRFCLLETSCEQDDNFPSSICVKVNDKVCPLPNPIPTNKPGVEPKRPGRPVNITSLCRLSPIISNYIDVSWASDLGRGYAVAVYLVNKITSSMLLQRLKSCGLRNADHTRALIKEKLSHDMDSEIATTSLKVSLMCPLGKSRMQLPCRPSTCTHIQCFDALLFLQMNEKKATWVCPVCDQNAVFPKLVIDGLFLEIVKEAPSECSEVKFSEDGQWSPLLPKNESQSPAKSTPKVYNVPTEVPKKNPDFEVVDLTFSSDEDEPPIKTKPPEIPNNNKTNKKVKPSSQFYNPYSRVEPSVVDLPTYKTMLSNSGAERTNINNCSNSSSVASDSNPLPSNHPLPTESSSQENKLHQPHLSSSSSSSSMNFYNSLPSLPNMDRELPNGLGVPPATSPYSDFLSNSMFSHLPNFDLYSLLHMSGVDGHRPVSVGSNRMNQQPSSHTSNSADGSPPDIIPLD